MDANNLYGYSMSKLSKFLLKGGFKWIVPNESDINKQTCNSSKGCVGEVGIEYPKELRE